MTSGLDRYLEESSARVSVSHNHPFPQIKPKAAYMIRCDVWTDGVNVFTKVKSDGNCVLIFDADTQQLTEMATF